MNYKLIDTHAHLDFPQFDGERQKVVEQAKNANVAKIINIGCNLKTSQKAIDLAENYKNIWASVGLHPSDANDCLKKDFFKSLHKLAKQKKVIAIGEIGLDYFHKNGEIETQKKAFIEQIKIAEDLKKPLIIHTREAGKDLLEILKKEKPTNAVIHCFSETQEFAETVLEMGYFLSFTGIVTYPKTEKLHQVIANTPLNRIMLETDCPFLAPQKFRGKRNEPAFVVEIAKKIAEIKQISLEEISQITTKNAELFFKI